MRRGIKAINLILIGSFFALSACSQNKKVELGAPDPELQKDFTLAFEALGAEKYDEAIKLFSSLMGRWPGSEYEVVATYNLGAAYEGKNDCNKASEYYRRAIQGSTKKFPRVEANALVRLGMMYECLGRDDKATVSLLDARRRSQFIDDAVLRAEIPARLVGSYARLGNKTEAQKYLKEALQGIRLLKAKSEDQDVAAKLLTQTLYLMGKPRLQDDDLARDPVRFMKGFYLTQTYLLQAAELGKQPWAKSATQDYKRFLKRYWDVVEQTSPDQKAQREKLAQEGLRVLRGIKAQRIPSRNETAEVKELFSFVENEERKFERLYFSAAPKTPLTKEAQRRDSLRREGKVKATAPSPLEKENQKP